jgi:hypothetical protein
VLLKGFAALTHRLSLANSMPGIGRRRRQGSLGANRFHEALVVWAMRRPALRSLDGLLASGIRAGSPGKDIRSGT